MWYIEYSLESGRNKVFLVLVFSWTVNMTLVMHYTLPRALSPVLKKQMCLLNILDNFHLRACIIMKYYRHIPWFSLWIFLFFFFWYHPTSLDGCQQSAWSHHPLASQTHTPGWQRFTALVWPQLVPQPFTRMAPHRQLLELSYGLHFCCFIWQQLTWSGNLAWSQSVFLS